MKWPRIPSRTPIGIDIGGHSIKAAQLRRSSRGWRVESAARLPRRSPSAAIDGDEIKRVVGALRRQGFCGDAAVVAVPSESLLTGLLELPPVGASAPLDQMARMEFARLHSLDPQSFEMVYWMLPESPARKGKIQLLVAACAHEEAEALLDMIETHGLNIAAIDARSCALARACAPVLAASTHIAGVLDLDWDSGQLLLLYQGIIVYERSLPEAGIGKLADALSHSLQIDEQGFDALLERVDLTAERTSGGKADPLEPVRGAISRHFADVLEDLRAPFSYVEQQYPGASVELLLLVGDGASIHGLDKHLSSALGIEARALSPADLAECPPPLLEPCSTGALIGAFGLAQAAN